MAKKPLTLRQRQELFARLLSGLIWKATFSSDSAVTLGEAWRHPKAEHGHPRSLHKLRLAIDLNLFKNGKYLTKTSDHEPLGEWWERQHELCRWGGRFGDGNHYSITYRGMK